jgi:hypothetical protein
MADSLRLSLSLSEGGANCPGMDMLCWELGRKERSGARVEAKQEGEQLNTNASVRFVRRVRLCKKLYRVPSAPLLIYCKLTRSGRRRGSNSFFSFPPLASV